VEKGRGQGPLAEEGGLYLDIFVGVPEFLVTPLLMRPIYKADLKSHMQSAPAPSPLLKICINLIYLTNNLWKSTPVDPSTGDALAYTVEMNVALIQ